MSEPDKGRVNFAIPFEDVWTLQRERHIGHVFDMVEGSKE